MLSAPAQTFVQKSRLAVRLSWVAGYTNVVVFILCGTFVSHVTGNATNFAKDLGRLARPLIQFNGFLVLSFFCGAALSAVLTEGARRRGLRPRYTLPLVVEVLLLTVTLLALRGCPRLDAAAAIHDPALRGTLYLIVGTASMAMGIQNATITKISGAVIRSTHLTGVITDLAIEGVQLALWYADRVRGRRWSRHGRVLRVSRRHPTAQRVALLAGILFSFSTGALLGGLAERYCQSNALVVPILALLVLILRDLTKPREPAPGKYA